MFDQGEPIVLVPVTVAILAGLLGIGVGGGRFTWRQAAWGMVAGYVGGALAAVGLVGEYLASGRTAAAAIAGVGGLIAGAVTGAVLRGPAEARSGPELRRGNATHGAGHPRDVVDAPAGRLEPPATPRSHDPRYRGGALAGIAALAIVAAALGGALLAVASLLLLATVALARRGWGLSAGFFTATATLGAVLVVLGKLVLSDRGWVGEPVAVVVVALLTLLPLMWRLTERETWLRAARKASLVDAAAVAVAVLVARGWLSLFDGLGNSEIISQLQRLGEDNAGHMMMLMSTTASGTALGTSARSVEINSGFTGYFPGGSLLQASIGGLLPAMSTPRLYVVSTAFLMALLAGGASAVASLARTRLDGFSALAVLVLGSLGARATLAMFEIGFPGQLATACWVVAGLTVLLAEGRRGGRPVWAAGTLVVLAVATYWSWSLAAPVLMVPVGVLALQGLRHRIRPTARTELSVVFVGAIVTLLALYVARHRIIATLDTLSQEGAVFRAIPFWFAIGLGLGLPLAYRVRGRREPAAGVSLVWGMAAALVLLTSWQMYRTGVITYYSYKIEYLMFVLGWAATALALAVVVGQVERRWAIPVRAVAVVAALAVAPLMMQWPQHSYRDWLTARAVIGADSVMSCAITQAHREAGSIVIATGFGEKLSNYLTTRAMDVGARNNASKPFWTPILYDAPTTWPWSAATRPVVIVEGPSASDAETTAIVAAGQAQDVPVTVAPHRCVEAAG